MTATIINIGDELLIGQVVNSNASVMSQMLTASGIGVNDVLVCGDTRDAILLSLQRALTDSDIVLITGGLGPTKDDVTKQVLCDYFGSELYENEEALANVRRIFSARGYELTEVNRRQAWVPRCCTMINNSVGTAPCMWFDLEGTARRQVVVSMAGVPFEMEHLMRTEIVPRLQRQFQTGVILCKNILTQGIGESFLSDLVEPWELSLPEGLSVAYLPVSGMVKMRLTARGSDETSLRKRIDDAAAALRAVAGQYIVGEDCETLPELVAQRFAERQLTLATAESCTGGAIAAAVTALAGASAYYRGGVVAYSNEVKQAMLGVGADVLQQHGAVSEPVVRQMAEGVRLRMGADYAVATSGVAGPGGGTAEKPVGTVWMALASPSGTVAQCKHYSGPRSQIVVRACNEIFAWLARSVR